MSRTASVSSSDLAKLVEQSKNDQVKAILQRENPSDLISADGTTPLHLAVIHDNLELIEYLSNLETHDVNAKNSSGDTALLLAVKSDNFAAAKFLVASNKIDICIEDAAGQTALKIIMTEYDAIDDVVPCFVENLRNNSSLDAEGKAKILVESHCGFEYVLPMNDPLVNRAYLKLIPGGDHAIAMELAMKQRDLANVELILLNETGEHTGRSAFYKCLADELLYSEPELWELFVEHALGWNVVDVYSLPDLSYMFESADDRCLRVLFDLKIDAYVREKFGIDLRTALFGNVKVDAVELLLQCEPSFDANSPTADKERALHLAVRQDLTKNVTFLLDWGADVDATDGFLRRTALHNCVLHRKRDSATLLLQRGADVWSLVDADRRSVIELAWAVDSPLRELLVARLAVDRARGLAIKKEVRDLVMSHEGYRGVYEACGRQLESSRACEVLDSMTLLDVLTGKIEEIASFVRGDDVLEKLDKFAERHQLNPLYYSTLKCKLERAAMPYRFKCQLARIVSDRTGTLVDFDHLVVNGICDLLTLRDISIFLQAVAEI